MTRLTKILPSLPVPNFTSTQSLNLLFHTPLHTACLRHRQFWSQLAKDNGPARTSPFASLHGEGDMATDVVGHQAHQPHSCTRSRMMRQQRQDACEKLADALETVFKAFQVSQQDGAPVLLV